MLLGQSVFILKQDNSKYKIIVIVQDNSSRIVQDNSNSTIAQDMYEPAAVIAFQIHF